MPPRRPPGIGAAAGQSCCKAFHVVPDGCPEASLRLFFAALALSSSTALAATADGVLLQNVSGTAENPGPVPHHAVFFQRGSWTLYTEGAASLTYTTQSGPLSLKPQLFSTNWFAAAGERRLGSKGSLLLRARVSLEPLTIPAGGAVQLLQYVSSGSGGPLADRMSPHELIGEIASHLALRTGANSGVDLYLAPVGDPPLGAVPFAQRRSAEEFAATPFSYDVAESHHAATRVATAGWRSTTFGLEAGVFHHAIPTGRRSSIDDGPVDSWAGRLTLRPSNALSFQFSHGSLGKSTRIPATSARLTTASVSYSTARSDTSVILARRAFASNPSRSAIEVESTGHFGRNHPMIRIENVDRPASDPLGARRTTHLTIGDVVDLFRRPNGRVGVGVNIDYHTSTKRLPSSYGHKPQGIYVYLRLRSDATGRF